MFPPMKGFINIKEIKEKEKTITLSKLINKTLRIPQLQVETSWFKIIG